MSPSETDQEASPYVPPRLHKLPAPSSQTPSLFAAEAEGGTFASTLDAVSRLPRSTFEHAQSEGLDSSARPVVHDLTEGQSITTSSATPLSLKVLHTPGHTTDSISLLFPSDNAIFTADTVLGEGTAVFEDLGAYMKSLRLLLEAAESLSASATLGDGASGSGIVAANGDEVALSGGGGKEEGTQAQARGNNIRIFPGHGPVLEDGAAALRMYISHRQEREDQIVALLPTSLPSPPSSTATSPPHGSIRAIVQNLYAKYPPGVWPAAERGVWLHLKKLEVDGQVSFGGVSTEKVDPEAAAGSLDASSSDVREFFSKAALAPWVRLVK